MGRRTAGHTRLPRVKVLPISPCSLPCTPAALGGLVSSGHAGPHSPFRPVPPSGHWFRGSTIGTGRHFPFLVGPDSHDPCAEDRRGRYSYPSSCRAVQFGTRVPDGPRW